MRFLNRLVVGFFLALPCSARAVAQDSMATSASVVSVETVAAASQVAPGADVPIALVLTIQPSWHIWTNDRVLPDAIARFDGAVLTSVRVSQATPSFRTGGDPAIQWPDYHTITADVGDGPKEYAVFEGRVIIFVPLSIAADAPAGHHRLPFTLEFQACTATNCVAPATVEASVEIEVRAGASAAPAPALFSTFKPEMFASVHDGASGGSTAFGSKPVEFDVFGFCFAIDPRGGGFLLLLAVAALGGLTLNFTPCVLPVIPLKIMGLARAAGNRRRCLALGIALSLGVICFWVALGSAVALISGFTSSSQLFHYPLFTASVGIIIAVMAFGMCGFFAIQLPQSVAGIDFRHDTLAGSVGFGVMTAVLSTPCTAPLMGAAAAWASTQAPWIVLLVFGAIGAGMALPYLVLSAFPQLVSHVPKSGPASDVVKQTMGLLLLAAAAYFIGAGLSGWMVSPPDPPSDTYWWFVSLLGVAAGLWLASRTLAITRRVKFRAIFCSLGIAIAVVSGSIGVRLTDHGAIDWIPYTPERLADARAEHEGVLIDFTAQWCLNCKTLEKTVLESAAVLSQLNVGGIRAIKVDLTGNNEPGRALLKSYNRLTIPLVVILDRNGDVLFQSDAYTPSQIVTALEQARASALR